MYGISRGLAKIGSGAKMFVIVIVLGLVSGCCTVPAQAVKQIESTHELVLPDYIGYVAKDESLNADQKDDRIKLVESLKRLTEALKKHTEE